MNSSSGTSRNSNKVVVNPHLLLHERDAQIAALASEVDALTNQLMSLNAKVAQRVIQKRKKALVAFGAVIEQQQPPPGNRLSLRGRHNLTLKRTNLGRNASISTAKALAGINSSSANDNDDTASTTELLSWIPSKKGRVEVQQITDRILKMFKDPAEKNNMKYLTSQQFASDIIRLNHYVKRILIEEPRCIFLQSPCYVFGDLHGNIEDLHFFSDNIWRLGMSLTAGNFVFLGDYVDRGMNCLEVVAYLLSMKVLLPDKVTLLRGNHETRDVNGWEEHYGPRSFIHQCNERFGEHLGYNVWESTNQVFDRMPLAAVIDQDIFCVHGGIPRPLETNESSVSRIQDILSVPNVSGINPPYEHEPPTSQMVASDCIWSDPASTEQERTCVDPHTGFGESLRGGGAICFGNKAVTDFLEQHQYSYIMRAHEAHAEGVAISKGARVFTVFSTSKDHNQGDMAMAGCILVDNEKLQVINRSPAYKNQYIHRRDSISLQSLSDKEIDQRIKLGLVTLDEVDDEDEEDVEDEQWDNIADEEYEVQEGEMEYVFDTRRASMVETHMTISSPLVLQRDTSSLDLRRLEALQEEDIEEEESTVDGQDAELTSQQVCVSPSNGLQRVMKARREYSRNDFF